MVDAVGNTRLQSLMWPPSGSNVADEDYFRAHSLGERGLYIGGAQLGRASGLVRFTLSQALRHDDGTLNSIVILGIEADYFRPLLSSMVTHDSVGTVFSPAGELLARTGGVGDRRTSVADEPFWPVFIGVPSGTVLIVPSLLDHVSRITAIQHEPHTGVVVTAALSYAETFQPWRMRAVMMAVVYLLSAAGVGALTAWVARVQSARDRAAQMLADANRDLEARGSERTAALDAALGMERDLRAEADHRIKNNLMLVSAYLALQARRTSDAAVRAPLDSARRRVHAIAKIHQQLASASASGGDVKIDEFLASLCAELESSSPSIKRIVLNAPEFTMSPDRAIWLGLAASELIANSAKHAYPVDAPGNIEVDLRRVHDGPPVRAPDEGMLELTVSDHGIGLPGDFSIDKEGGLGMKIVLTLARQLDGEVRQKPMQRGVSVAIRFHARAPASSPGTVDKTP